MFRYVVITSDRMPRILARFTSLDSAAIYMRGSHVPDDALVVTQSADRLTAGTPLRRLTAVDQRYLDDLLK